MLLVIILHWTKLVCVPVSNVHAQLCILMLILRWHCVLFALVPAISRESEEQKKNSFQSIYPLREPYSILQAIVGNISFSQIAVGHFYNNWIYVHVNYRSILKSCFIFADFVREKKKKKTTYTWSWDCHIERTNSLRWFHFQRSSFCFCFSSIYSALKLWEVCGHLPIRISVSIVKDQFRRNSSC